MDAAKAKSFCRIHRSKADISRKLSEKTKETEAIKIKEAEEKSRRKQSKRKKSKRKQVKENENNEKETK